MAQIRKSFKGNIAREENKRKYVIPECGFEANLFWKYRKIIGGKSVNWPCVFVDELSFSDGVVGVFQYEASVKDVDVMRYTLRPIEEGEFNKNEKKFYRKNVDNRKVFPNSGMIRYPPPYDSDRW